LPKVDINGVGIYYDESGLPDKTPFILCSHGRKSWMWQFYYFSEYYRVITPDRRGTGFSDDPEGKWTVKDYCDDLLGLMDHLGIEKAIVGGHSLGGAISCLFGLDHPDRVLALIFSGQCYYWDKLTNEWADERLAGKATLETQPKSFEWDEQGPPTTNPEFAKSPHGAYYLQILREAGKWRTPEQLKKNSINQLKALRGWDMRPRAKDLKRLGEKVPVLIMIGEEESQGGIPLAYEWSKAIPNSEFIINERCYHAAPREDPALWNSRVHGFLKRHGL
jgi:pimeloyl-ACP methyl ester carboxylesterase